jgi:CopG family nickel-responsive transcriptional regulator
MRDNLIRFGVAMESSLVAELDALAAARGSNRSELLRDLARAEMSRARLAEPVPAVASVTLVYNHHVRELSERLTALQHDLGEQVRSTMHVHLDHDHCMEVIVMRGRANTLRATIDGMLGTRGVLHGGAEFVAESMLSPGVDSTHGHHADHHHGHAHEPARPSRKAKTPKKSKN